MSHGKEPAPADVQRILTEMDINSDGVISLEEFTAWYLRCLALALTLPLP